MWAREGTAGRRKNSARLTCPRTSTLRISHFPNPRTRRYARHRRLGRPREWELWKPLVDTEGSRHDTARKRQVTPVPVPKNLSNGVPLAGSHVRLKSPRKGQRKELPT